MRALLLISAFCVLSTLAGAEWQGAAQPDLAEQIQAAKAIETENLYEPIRATRRDAVLRCPNPDGKT